jgi:hypothetical protein
MNKEWRLSAISVMRCIFFGGRLEFRRVGRIDVFLRVGRRLVRVVFMWVHSVSIFRLSADC